MAPRLDPHRPPPENHRQPPPEEEEEEEEVGDSGAGHLRRHGFSLADNSTNFGSRHLRLMAGDRHNTTTSVGRRRPKGPPAPRRWLPAAAPATAGHRRPPAATAAGAVRCRPWHLSSISVVGRRDTAQSGRRDDIVAPTPSSDRNGSHLLSLSLSLCCVSFCFC